MNKASRGSNVGKTGSTGTNKVGSTSGSKNIVNVNKSGGNWPSKTINPSGKGRRNSPRSK